MPVLEFQSEQAVRAYPGGQKEFAEDWKHFMIALEGGWMSGKSWCGANKLVTLHEYNAFDTIGDPTYVPSLCVAPTYGNATDFCLPHLFDSLDAANLKYYYRQTGSISGGRMSAPAIVIPELGTRKRPSLILVRTADVPKRITGFEVGAAWGDEAARWKSDRLNPMNDPFIQITGRVRHPLREELGLILQIMFTYTNEGDATKVYDLMHAGDSTRKLYRARTQDNPQAMDFYQRQLGNLSKELVEQYLEGKAASLRGGKVYPEFDPMLHVDERITLRRELPLQIMLDFNIMPGMHLEVGQHHGDIDLLTVTHEIHGPRMSVSQAVDAFADLVKNELKWNFEQTGPLHIFGDATGASEWAGTGDSCYEILQNKLQMHEIPFRMRVPSSNPRVIDRVNAFNCALLDVDGGVHWKCHPRCERLKEDLRVLSRNEFGEIDTVERKLSHASDAEGYRIWFVRPIRVQGGELGGRVGFGN